MSDNDKEEPMEVDNNNTQPPSSSHDNPAEALMPSSKTEDEALLTLSFVGLESDNPQKTKTTLEKVLQSWFNKRKATANCSVAKTSRDGRALIRINPTPDLHEVETLVGETLTNKEGKKVTITSVSLTPKNQTQMPEDASLDLHPSSVSVPPQDDQVQEQSSCGSSAAVSTAGEETCYCDVPVSHFWYVNHIYKEEMKRIKRENGVKISAEVRVTFESDRKDGRLKAFYEFINLVQKCLGESEGSVIPLKPIDPEEVRDTLKIIQKNEKKLLLTLNSEEMIVCGPRESQDLIKKTLNTSQKTFTHANTSVGEPTWASQDIAQKIDMSIRDQFADAGLTMEESSWKLLTTSFNEQLTKIKTKFGVDFKESDISQGKVIIKPCYKSSGGNASMESHAVRALLHLYQKSTTSPMNLTQLTLSGPALNGAPTEEGATAGDNKEEKCPICMDAFTNKKRLKCKHEFCEECLAQSKKSMGPICPICKDVFGMVKGDQPDGTMTWTSFPYSLNGFPDCGQIVIHYDIPGGKQTEKHPNPGQRYSGIHRTAYLPDNKEGNEVLHLLKKAFDQKLIFTVGTSRTTGMDNMVTWNDIHHKTSVSGGPESFGYPDPGYLSRVREELKAKGIK
ncbi:E3 ubiquitin-protein ligase DTX3L [Thunnus albacares]|uniref:E3 ubiquitin-protein ligase DTX3L n=1 Tax=Thunnus albacares TaxID=8236 RepID=UPI001CF6FF4A|nr:E3 ubiquitin-protein ligase DTX3L [Thunnus albacares]